MSILIKPGIYDIDPCPFCDNDYLFYLHKGALCCDDCQAEGPFADGSFEEYENDQTSEEFQELFLRALMLWNARGRDAHELVHGE